MKYIESVQTVIANNTTKRVLYVSSDEGNDANDGSFARPFKTIQAAINAAIAFPATANTPIVIKIYPSTSGNVYTENLSITQQGIFLESISPTYKPDCVDILGTVTVNLSGTAGGANFVASLNDFYMRGVVVSGGASNALHVTGTAFQRVFLNSCIFESNTSGVCVLIDNSGTSGGSKSTVTARDCDISNNDASNAAISLTAGNFFNAGSNPSVSNSNASGASVSVSTTGSFTINNASITGQISVTSNTAGVIITNSSITSGTNSCIATPATPSTGTITIDNVALSSSNTNTITGSGVLVLGQGNLKTSTSGDIVSTVTQAALNSLPQGQTLFGTTATAATNALIITKNGHYKSEQTTAPTISTNANAGTGASSSVSNATDNAGNVSLTSGSLLTPAAGIQLTITFNKAFNVAPIILLTPTNANAGNNAPGFYITSATGTFSIAAQAAPASTTTYTWNYWVIETQ